MEFTLDTTLGDLLDHEQARAVLDEHLPGVADNPMVGMARGMSLRALLSLPQARQFGLTEEKAEELLAQINSRI